MAAGATVWLTGLPGSGKSTAAVGLSRRLASTGIPSQVLDGDVLRHGLSADLGFSKEDRSESIRRAGEVALLLASSGLVTVVGLVSPYATARDGVRRRHQEHGLAFMEVWLSAPLEVCEARDPKQLYARARRGEVPMMTGVDDPYEPPPEAELEVPTHRLDVASTVDRIFTALLELLES